jgi:hypothetical protein
MSHAQEYSGTWLVALPVEIDPTIYPDDPDRRIQPQSSPGISPPTAKVEVFDVRPYIANIEKSGRT